MTEENCIACALKYLVWFTSFCGIPGFYIECSHRDGDSSIEIVKSKVHIGIWIFMLIYVGAFCSYFAMLVVNFNNPDIAVLFFNILILMDTVRSLLIMIISFYKSKHFENSLTITNTYLRRWKLAFQEPLLKRKDCSMNVAALMVCYMWCLFLIYFLTVQINSSLPFSKKLGKMAKASVHADLMLTVILLVLLRIYSTLSKNCQQFVMNKLDCRQTNPAMKNYIVKLMKHYRLINIMIHKVTQQFGMFYNPTMVITVLLVTFLAINGTVAVIYGSDSDNYTIQEIWELPFQLCVSLTVTIFSFQECNRFISMNDDFLTYLYKYPISKLHREEAQEIETTIEIINHKKLELKLGNILTPGLQMIASYIGTILTYVLVVVQFVKDLREK